MKKLRVLLVALFVSGALLGTAAPASASLLRIDQSRAGEFCFIIHTGGLLDPIPVCIPLI